MFLGRYYHSLEGKGRLAIPVSFRKLLGKSPILTRGLDSCLYLLPSKSWTKLIADLHTSPLANTDTRTLTRLLSHNAQVVSFDAQGRALLNPDLRDFAGLTKNVVVAGSLTWVEIWDQSRYHAHLNNAQNQINQIAERINRVR